jgi:hypothetical protein
MEHTVRVTAVALLTAWLLWPIPGSGQIADFKVAWIDVGEVLSSAANGAAAIKPGSKVARVDVQPTIIEVAVGEQVCASALRVRTFAADGQLLSGVRLAIAVRQDHKVSLQLTRSKGFCMRPARSGEYPIRLTSKVPAADDTLRGAQVFLRAR